jgi:hypothetical protein
VAAAILGANARNAQPWLFDVGDDRIAMFADLARSERSLDPLHREMHVGLGCALENLVLAARANGLEPDVRLTPGQVDGAPAADVVMQPGEPDVTDLYRAIPHRRTNRGPFRDQAVPTGLLDDMSQLGVDDLPDVELSWFTTPQHRHHVGELLVAATEAIIGDDEQSQDGYGWFRKTRREIERHRDGTTVATQGLPSLVSAVGRAMPRQSRRAADEFWLRRTRTVHTATAAAYGLVSVPDAGRVVDRMQGGRLLQRLHLFATSRGLAVGHLNMMTVRADRERQTGGDGRFTAALADLVRTPGRQALAMFRIGYPVRPAGTSPRRPVASVLTVQRGSVPR